MSKSPQKRFLDRMVNVAQNIPAKDGDKSKKKPMTAEEIIRAAKRLPTAHLDDIPPEVLRQFESVGPKCWCVIMENILNHSHLVERLERIGESVQRAGQADTTAMDEMILRRKARRLSLQKRAPATAAASPPPVASSSAKQVPKPAAPGPIFTVKLDQ